MALSLSRFSDPWLWLWPWPWPGPCRGLSSLPLLCPFLRQAALCPCCRHCSITVITSLLAVSAAAATAHDEVLWPPPRMQFMTAAYGNYPARLTGCCTLPLNHSTCWGSQPTHYTAHHAYRATYTRSPPALPTTSPTACTCRRFAHPRRLHYPP